MFRRLAATLLLAFLAAAAILPAAAAGVARKGCHCPIRMECCENGTCRMGEEPPADGPEWRTCRRETPRSLAAPLDAFETALKKDFFEGEERAPTARLEDLSAVRSESAAREPATPPPRLFSF